MFNLAGVRAIHTQDGKDIIMSIESSWLQLETSSKADDENLIAEVVKQKMDKGMVKNTPKMTPIHYEYYFELNI